METTIKQPVGVSLNTEKEILKRIKKASKLLNKRETEVLEKLIKSAYQRFYLFEKPKTSAKHFRISSDHKEMLRILSEKSGMTMNEYLNSLIKEKDLLDNLPND